MISETRARYVERRHELEEKAKLLARFRGALDRFGGAAHHPAAFVVGSDPWDRYVEAYDTVAAMFEAAIEEVVG